MKRFVLTLSLLTVSLAGRLPAQEPNGKDFLPPPPPSVLREPRPARLIEQQVQSPSDLPAISMTPELWLYLQEMKRYDDPKQAVRRKAEQRSAARRARLAAMQWYGFSNSRPQASASPWMSTYSPGWSGNSWDPYRHNGVSWYSSASRVEEYDYRR